MYVFQPLYLNLSQNIPLWQLFVNWSLSPILTLVVQNFWSKKVDETQQVKKYILASNLTLAVIAIYTFFINSFWMLLVITILGGVCPNGEMLANVLVYKLSDRATSEISNPIEKEYHTINFYARYRRYGSIGYAIGLPLIALLLDVTGLRSGLNFWVFAGGMVALSIWLMVGINENLIMIPQAKREAIPEKKECLPKEKEQINLSLAQKYRVLFSNKIYLGFILATLLFYTAYISTDQVQGLFYNLISRNNFFELMWIYSIAALVKWPVMTIVARQVKKLGWQKMITLVYVLTGLRLSIMPLIFIFNGSIYWGYLLQLYSGIMFGLTWQTTTFGLYVTLSEDQKALGQSFFGTIYAIAASLSGLIGFVISLNIKDQYLIFYNLHWIAGLLAILSGCFFTHIAGEEVNY